jgi:hypothetical protein
MNHARHRLALIDHLDRETSPLPVHDTHQPATLVAPAIVVTWAGSSLNRDAGWTHRYTVTLIAGPMTPTDLDTHTGRLAVALAVWAPTTSAATAGTPNLAPGTVDVTDPVTGLVVQLDTVTASITVIEPSTA